MLEFEVRGDVLQFEHSLLSLSKWEARTKKPFFGSREKQHAEMIDYLGDMLLTPGFGPEVVYLLSPQQLDELTEYISDSQTASTPKELKSTGASNEVITSELVYSWLVGLKIPFHPVETWHYNRLMVLIQFVSLNNTPPEKRSEKERMADFAEINRRNREILRTKG